MYLLPINRMYITICFMLEKRGTLIEISIDTSYIEELIGNDNLFVISGYIILQGGMCPPIKAWLHLSS